MNFVKYPFSTFQIIQQHFKKPSKSNTKIFQKFDIEKFLWRHLKRSGHNTLNAVEIAMINLEDVAAHLHYALGAELLQIVGQLKKQIKIPEYKVLQLKIILVLQSKNYFN